MFVEIASFDTGAKIFAGVAEKNKLIQKYLDTMNDADIDLLILPASLVPAPKKVSIELFQSTFNLPLYLLVLLLIFQ